MCFVKPLFSPLLSASEELQLVEDRSWVEASWGSCPICHLEALFTSPHGLFAGSLHLQKGHSSFLSLGTPRGGVTAN